MTQATCQKLFWENPYQTKLDTRVNTTEGDRVTLKETIFFAFSGGQESDAGTIAGYPVLKAEKVGLEICYTLPEGHTLQEGDTVTVCIDWERRLKLMRLHFAAEITLVLFTKKLGADKKIGAHIAPEKARIDFAIEDSLAPLVPQIQKEAQAIIDANLPIECDFSDRDQERRFWKIDGFAEVPCGGTHLKSTREVGTLGLRRKNPGKGKERIEILLD